MVLQYRVWENCCCELHCLQVRSAQRAEALRLSEVGLDEDAQRFDKFLKDSDAGVQEAMRKADVEARARQAKVRHSVIGPWYGSKPPQCVLRRSILRQCAATYIYKAVCPSKLSL